MARKVDRPFANGTWTHARMMSFLRSNLRKASIKWPPIQAAKKAARREYSGPNKRQKWEYQCNMCFGWFMGKDTQVDHITPAGSLKSFDDLPGFVSRLFCEMEGLQVLCTACHKSRKTDIERHERNNET